MKKKFFVILIFFFMGLSEVFADKRKDQLDKLFKELKVDNPVLNSEVEKKIWRIWSTHPNKNNLTLMLSEGSNLVKNNQLYEAVQIFTKVIALDPKWAEAWNKRATVFYLIGEYEKSQNDIDKVLKLQPRHFGAIAGSGLIYIKKKKYEKALNFYKTLDKIDPMNEESKMFIKLINKILLENSA